MQLNFVLAINKRCTRASHEYYQVSHCQHYLPVHWPNRYCLFPTESWNSLHWPIHW